MKSHLQKCIAVFFVAALLACIGFGCKQKLFKKIDYDGVAYDHTTGLPLQDTKIELQACGGGPGDKATYGCQGDLFVIGSGVTDANGNFHISGKAARSDIYYVFIKYNNGNYGAFADGVGESALKSNYSTIYLYH